MKPTRFTDYRDYLAAVYHALKQYYDSYSYVQFTIDLGFGECNAIYLIIRGERPLTRKGAQKIVDIIGLVKTDRQYLLKLVEFEKVSDAGKKDRAFEALMELKRKALPTVLEKNQLEFYNNWYNGAIVELLRSETSSDDPEELGNRLLPRVTPAKVKKSLELLEKLGHLTMDTIKGRLVPTQQVLSTGPEVLGMAIIRYHQQMIDLAKEAITGVKPEDRDINALTINVTKDLKRKIQADIHALRKKLIDLSKDVKEGDEILQVNVQMFPVATGFKKGGSQ